MAFEDFFGTETPNTLSFPVGSASEVGTDDLTTAAGGLGRLPLDIFLLVISFLEPRDVVKCRNVCKGWKNAFSNPETLYSSLNSFFPHARETRFIAKEIRDKVVNKSESSVTLHWVRSFDEVAARYFSLNRGRCREIHKFNQFVRDEETYYFPVKAWDEHESFGAQNQPFLFDHTFWSYDDGLLAFPSEEVRSIVVLDVFSKQKVIVPFSMTCKVIRNLRLKQRVLVIEWAEINPFHQLNELEPVHRHFATCFDVVKSATGLEEGSWQITLRNEWKMHFLGLPLSDRDKFFSNHTCDYYVVYIWQPNRSMYTGREIETLAVWDISHPSKYLPSNDVSGKHVPEDQSLNGPHAIHRYDFRDLRFYGILQKDSPSMMSFHIDDTAENIVWVENEYVRPTNAFNLGQNQWRSRVTTIPLTCGPVNCTSGELSLPPYAGSCSFEAVDQRDIPDQSTIGVIDVVDEPSHVSFSLLRTNLSGPFNWTIVKIRADEERTVELDGKLAEQVTYKGRIAGDERVLIGENDRQEIVVLKF